MIVTHTILTPALRRWLEAGHDDDWPPLLVRQVGESVEVTRADGCELSDREQTEVTALMAAHAVEPLK